MKRTPLRKKGKQKISVIQRKVWELCKQIIRKKYPNVCYTCDTKGLSGSNWHTGHLYAKASLGAFLKYDLRVLRPQCAKCNLFFGGMGAVFYTRMFRENGEKYMNQLEKDKQITVKAYPHYEKLINEYTEILYEDKGYT